MSYPKSTRFLISMTAVVLLVAIAAVNGASVAVDSKSSDVAQPENAQPDTDAAAQVRTKQPETQASVAEEHESSDPRIGLYAQEIVNLDSVGPIGANKAFYLASTDGGYGQPVSGQTSYPVNMPAYSNYAMGPPPSNQYSYASYQTPSAYPQVPQVPQAVQPPVYTGSLYGGVFSNPPPSSYSPAYSPAYAQSYTTTPPPMAPPYPPPSTTTPPPAQAYTEAYQQQAQPSTQQPPYNMFTPYAFASGYAVNPGFGMVPGYGGAAVAPVSPSSFSSYGAPVSQVAQVPYGSPLPAYAPMQQTSTYGMPMSAMPYGVNMNRIPDAYVSSAMGGYASYAPVNAAPVMPQMNTFSGSFVPLSSEFNPGMASVPNVGAYPAAPPTSGY